MTPAQKLISALFNADDVVNLRVIANGGGKARNVLGNTQNIKFDTEYPDAFPCIGINPRKSQKELSTIKNLVIDIDGGPLPEWARERADVICSRGKDHHHLYFCFATGATREQYKAAAASLIALIPQADEHVSDPERVMRLPGFEHRKDGKTSEGYKVVFIRKKIDRLPIQEKFAWLKTPEPAQQVSSAQPAPTAQPVAAPNAVAYLKNLYLKKDKLGPGEGRSRRLWFIGIDCHAWGVLEADAVKLALEINETFTPPETERVVSHQVASAYKYAKSEFGALATRSADATDAKKRAEQRAFERAQKVRDLFSSWVYVHAAARFIDSETGFALASKEQIEDYISARIGEPVSLRDLLSRDALTRCDRMEFDPAREEQIFNRDGLSFLNAYVPARHPAARDEKLKKTAVKIFKEHVGFITTSEDEEKSLLDYFAFCVQNKGKKCDWTPLIISKEGVGKSVFYSLFSQIFGEHNCSTVDAANLLEGWTDFIAEKLFVVSHEVEMTDKQGLTKLKTLITEKRVRINAKYERKYETTNCANFLLLSNEANALRLSGESRRFFVIFSRSEPRPKEYYAELFNAIEGGAGWIEDYLMSRDLSSFTPHGPAPKTEGLRILAYASRGDGVAWMDDRAEAKAGAFAEAFITATAIRNDALGTGLEKYVTGRAASAWLANNGYRPVKYRVGEDSRRGWFKGDEIAFQTELKKLREKVAKK